MIVISDENVAKFDKIADSMAEFSGLLNELADANTFLSNEYRKKAEIFDCISQKYRNDRIKILVIGKFVSGKSTCINALIGEQAMKATACITEIKYGDNGNDIVVHYKDGSVKSYNYDEFIKEMQFTEEDVIELEKCGIATRFDEFHHVEMQSTNEFFKDGITLVDTVGIDELITRHILEYEYIPQADVVIFMLNANSLFSKTEREFIDKNFAGKGMRNVFFVVNRINQLFDASQLDSTVKPSVKYHLEEVFTDKNGRFDEELYSKRVFFVDAYGALCAATNTPYKVLVGRKEIEIEISKEETGFPELECALCESINSEICNKWKPKELALIADTYDYIRSLEEMGNHNKISTDELVKMDKCINKLRHDLNRAFQVIAKNISTEVKVHLSLLQIPLSKCFAYENLHLLSRVLFIEEATLRFMKRENMYKEWEKCEGELAAIVNNCGALLYRKKQKIITEIVSFLRDADLSATINDGVTKFDNLYIGHSHPLKTSICLNEEISKFNILEQDAITIIASSVVEEWFSNQMTEFIKALSENNYILLKRWLSNDYHAIGRNKPMNVTIECVCTRLYRMLHEQIDASLPSLEEKIIHSLSKPIDEIADEANSIMSTLSNIQNDWDTHENNSEAKDDKVRILTRMRGCIESI